MIFNVKDFGAVGNGLTDDRVAIQAAVNAARAAGGGEVYIPVGIYAVSGAGKTSLGAIQLYDNVTVYGGGMGRSVVKVKDGWSGDITGVFRTPYGVETSNVGMHDITIDGNRANTTGKIDGWFNGVKPGSPASDHNITLNHVEIKDMSGYGFDPHERTDGLVITNSVSHGNGLDGFVMDFQTNAYFGNNVAYDNDRHGFNIVTSTNNSTLENNIAYDNGGSGIVVQRGSSNIAVPYNIKIIGGEYYNNVKDGIQINKADTIEISGANIYHNGERGIRVLGSKDSLIHDNMVHENSQSKLNGYEEISLAIYDERTGVSGKIFLTTGTKVYGNTITGDGHASYGIRELADGSDYNYIYGNTITGTVRAPVVISGSHSALSEPIPPAPPYEPPPVDPVPTDGPTVTKADWWHKLAGFYNFANDANPNVSVTTMLAKLHDYAGGHFESLLQSSFTSKTHLIVDPLLPDRGNILLANAGYADFVVGHKGFDYLGGGDRDDILFGGSGNDIFNPGAGNDLIIGGEGKNSPSERDTVTYLTATSGIVVDAEIVLPGGSAVPVPTGTVYTYTYQDWVDHKNTRITGFVTGQGGGVINVADLLQHVGYTGTNPVADGYIRIREITDGVKIQFDPDGLGGVSATSLVQMTGVSFASFSATYNLAFTPQAVLPEDLTYVSNDGQGGYDVLYSIENIYGSDFNDVIHGRNNQNNTLFGGLGDDSLYGEGGNDTLSGGGGTNIIYGGTGNDLILIGSGNDILFGGEGRDTFKFESGSSTHGTVTIEDFQAGPNGDRLDVSELLLSAGYKGTDAIGDGYISGTIDGQNILVYFDKDGRGAAPAELLATVKNVNFNDVSLADNLITKTPSILYVAPLGQSNMSGLGVEGGDRESGLTFLKSDLQAKTDFTRVEAVGRDENNYYVNIAVGGTSVDGDENDELARVWWYPAENRPSDLLIRAIDLMALQMADLRAQGSVLPAIVWGQGEAEANRIGGLATEAERLAAEQSYINSTRAIFDYIQDRLGDDIQFYIAQTGNYNVEGAQAAGKSAASTARTLEGLHYVHDGQEQLALLYDDVHLAVNYSDLPMQASMPSTTPGYNPLWAQDTWHMAFESREIMGQRIADYIALDLGYDNVLDDPGPYPLRLLSDLDLKQSRGLEVTGNALNNIVVGTLGNDTLHGGDGNDVLYGGAGHDVLYGDAGRDTFYYDPASFVHSDSEKTLNLADVIADFTVGVGGDVIDISALLEGNFGGTNPVTDGFVKIEQSGNDILISVDQDGAAGTVFNAVEVARLTGADANLFDPVSNLNWTVKSEIA